MFLLHSDRIVVLCAFLLRNPSRLFFFVNVTNSPLPIIYRERRKGEQDIFSSFRMDLLREKVRQALLLFYIWNIPATKWSRAHGKDVFMSTLCILWKEKRQKKERTIRRWFFNSTTAFCFVATWTWSSGVWTDPSASADAATRCSKAGGRPESTPPRPIAGTSPARRWEFEGRRRPFRWLCERNAQSLPANRYSGCWAGATDNRCSCWRLKSRHTFSCRASRLLCQTCGRRAHPIRGEACPKVDNAGPSQRKVPSEWRRTLPAKRRWLPPRHSSHQTFLLWWIDELCCRKKGGISSIEIWCIIELFKVSNGCWWMFKLQV